VGPNGLAGECSCGQAHCSHLAALSLMLTGGAMPAGAADDDDDGDAAEAARRGRSASPKEEERRQGGPSGCALRGCSTWPPSTAPSPLTGRYRVSSPRAGPTP
jgi:hypothetical protein